MLTVIINIYMPSYTSVWLIMKQLDSYSKLNVEDFGALNFELTNFHLFQEKIMPVLHDSNVTMRYT